MLESHDFSLIQDRVSEMHHTAHAHHVASRLGTARRWSRIASWAQARARRAERRVG